MTRNHKDRGALLADSVLAWLFFFTAFISVPSVIYMTNQIDLNFDLRTITPFLAVGFLAFPLLVLLAHGLSSRHRTTVYVLLFYIGMFLFLKDVLAPLEWEHSHRDQQPDEPLLLTLVELGIALALAAAWWKVPVRPLRVFAVPLVLVVAAVQTATFIFNLASPADVPGRVEGTDGIQAAAEPAVPVDKPNIYHVVFDAYSAQRFGDAADQLNMAEKLTGFTEFRNNLANYPYTKASVPSFLAGTYYEPESLREWRAAANTGGIRRALDDAGYRMWIYAPNENRYWMYSKADHVRTSYELAQSALGSTLRLALFTTVRLAPNVLRTEVFWSWDRFSSFLVKRLAVLTVDPLGMETYAYYKHLSVPLMRLFLEEEKLRTSGGNYVYVHVMLPHTPFVWNEQCTFSPEDQENGFYKQTLCATKLMAEIAATLKSHNRYHSSLIIFQSDHGHEADSQSSVLETGIPDHAREAVVSKLGLKPGDLKDILKRMHALLLVKPPNDSGLPLTTSPVFTQLVDIPATIADLVGVEYPPGAGRSVFALEPDTPREIELFLGSLRTDLFHLSYTRNGHGNEHWEEIGLVTNDGSD